MDVTHPISPVLPVTTMPQVPGSTDDPGSRLLPEVSPLLPVPIIPQVPGSANNPASRLLVESSAPQSERFANKSPPSGTRPVEKYGFIRTWLATSTNLRPTGDPNNIEWGIHWYTPVSIIGLLFLGTATAVAHHLFYSFLHDDTVGDATKQRWTSWIGSGLSFLTKVSLTAALGISRTQWVWLTLRSKWFTLNGIDALFGVVSDPLYFLHWKMMKNAMVPTIMAIGMWIFPLTAILTPGTLSVRTVQFSDTVVCTVPTLLFKFDHNSTAIIPRWTDLPENISFVTMGLWMLDNSTWSDRRVMRPLQLPAYTGTVTSLPDLPSTDSPSLTTLGAECGLNCTYTVEFLGPTVTCAEFTDWKNQTIWDNSTHFMGNNSYQSMGNSSKGIFLVSIWHVELGQVEPFAVLCESTTAHYTVQHVVEERRFLEPVILAVETVKLPDFEPEPKFPNDVYMPVHSLFMAMQDLLEGQFSTGGSVDTRSVSTVLMDAIYTDPYSIGRGIEHIAHMMIASMIAFDLVIQGEQQVLNIAAIQETNCTRTQDIVRYVYSARTLIVLYGLAVACALVISIAGFIALGHNGMASNRNVSAIIRTTRNRTLDDSIVGGDSLGGNIMSTELEKVELRFGALNEGKSGTAPFALGVKGEISRIKRD